MSRPEDVQATFCATLVDEWARCGVRHAVVAPGSRSTPLALALLAQPAIEVHVHIDERSAGFLALGLALASGEPTVVLTTSGTAAVELHPAVVEADLAGVPLIVCTADRPAELIGVAAPQAIDQTHLYGRAVRWFHAPGVPEAGAAARWRPLAGRAYGEAVAPRRGPVHLNLAFREPLTGSPEALPPGRADGRPWVELVGGPVVADAGGSVLAGLAGQRGLIVAGTGSGAADAVAELAIRLGWPVLAAPQAPVWCRTDVTVAAADALLRVEALTESMRPEVILHLGPPLASRVVGEWCAASGARHVVVADGPGWVDPHGTAAVLVRSDPAAQVAAWLEDQGSSPEPAPKGWAEQWLALGRAARAAVADVLAAREEPSEPGVAQALVDALPEGSNLVVSSSMPVRDLEWYADPSKPLAVHANRGANGIDGVVATAVGMALGSGRPTGLLIGDLAFLHDSNGLIGARQRGIDLTVAVVDNDGGGIFSFLAQAEALPGDDFERLFGTPHGLDLVAVAEAHGATAREAAKPASDIAAAVEEGGVQVVVVSTDRADNRSLHAELNRAVAHTVERRVAEGL